ncbi:nuclease-related domain-containing protein [Haliea sp. E17]|uniref:nuclease-related domain-containing protein n=1 Tax=Haliea sp. E17 TaxID=3401576 RepID=UPI003AADE6E5
MHLLITFLLAGPFCLATYLLVKSQTDRQARFKNPLTKSLRRPPGAELGRKLGNAQFEAGFDAFSVILPCLIPGIIYTVFQGRGHVVFQSTMVGLSAIVACALWFQGAKKFRKRFEEIRTLRLGYECELAVGQELDLLMLRGYRVFHDLQAENFNIDHVVVGRSGIYAVETKGRSKLTPTGENSTAEFRVTYQSGQLRFPGYTDKTTVPQAARQAQWLSTWLSSATGLNLKAIPLVVLPGWYIELKDRPTVPVIASGYIDGFFSRRYEPLLDDEQLTRVIHQLDAKVRDLKPGEVVRPKPEPG